MDDASELLSQGQDDLAENAMEAVGVGEPTEDMVEDRNAPLHMKGDGNSGQEAKLPVGVQQRLGRQEKRHQKELRQMRAELQAMQQMLGQQPNNSEDYSQQMAGQQYGEPNPQVDDQIQRAVNQALRAQDEQRRKAKDRESALEVSKKYESLQDNLDKGSDKYDDFDDVVRGQDAPFTPAMRDAALFIDNPADVLYKLGKNKPELKRIAALHPVDQAREMVKLSHALMSGSGKDAPRDNNSASRPIGQVKSNPVNHSSVTEATPVGDIRRRMKAGDWKGGLRR